MALGFLRRQTPLADAAEAPFIADRGGKRRRCNYPHRRQDDRELEVRPLGQRI